MKIITREYQVYDFKDLSNEAKDYAIEKWYESEDYPFLSDDIEQELYQIDEHQVFEEVKLQYSLSCCQGDGLSFSCNINLDNFLRNIYSEKLKELYINALCDYIYKIYSTGNMRRYCFAHRSDIDYNINYQDYKEHKYINLLWEKVFEEIQNYYMNTCKQLEKYGYDILDYRMDYNEFAEHCDTNDYKFFENGKMFNY